MKRGLPFAVPVVLFAAACGASPRAATHEDFRRIQRAEEAIAQASGENHPGSAARRRQTICASAQAICDISDATEDGDALTRCRRASGTCRSGPLPRAR